MMKEMSFCFHSHAENTRDFSRECSRQTLFQNVCKPIASTKQQSNKINSNAQTKANSVVIHTYGADNSYGQAEKKYQAKH